MQQTRLGVLCRDYNMPRFQAIERELKFPE
jgi:hypothetical protein